MYTPIWSLPVRAIPQSLTVELRHRMSRMINDQCPDCHLLSMKEEFIVNANAPPPFIAVGLDDRRHVGEGASQPKITAQVTVGSGQDKVVYKVRGLIYWDKAHFTCRMIGKGKQVYYNDGHETGNTCIPEGPLSEIEDLYNLSGSTEKGFQLTYIILSLV